jgi:hypothetical protein
VDGTVQSTGSGTNAIPSGITLGTDGGILGFGVEISNAVTLNDDIRNGSQASGHNTLGTNGRLKGSGTYYTILATNSTSNGEAINVSAGFSNNLADTATSVAGQQIQVGVPPPSSTDFLANGNSNISSGGTMIPIFGLGQTGGSMGGDFIKSVPSPSASGYAYGSSTPASGKYVFSGPVLAVNPNSNGHLYLTSLLVAEGTYSSTLPTLLDTGSTVPYLENELYAAPGEAYSAGGGYTSSSPAVVLFTETLGTSAVPEPASLGLLTVGAMGLLARRRRRHAQKQ